jgi:hypothetical protein
MMLQKFYKIAAFAAAAALAGVPAISQAVTTDQSTAQRVSYDTSITPINGLEAPWNGTLKITINPDGIIQGYYHPAYEVSFIPVTGGRNGDSVWMDIGSRGRIRVNGTLQNGKIVGSAYDQNSNTPYKFIAIVAK